jgi:metal-sulfur cluster biosynthetic enzyme
MSKPAKRAEVAAPDYITPDEADPNVIERVRTMMREARDREGRINDLKSVLAEESKALQQMKMVTLPELFTQAGIDQLGLPAEGNNPAYDFKRRTSTHASIGADWDDERRKEAFKVLEENGGKDLIKTEITVYIPSELRKLAKKVLAALKPFKGIEVETNLTVPWNTLTAFVKEATQQRGLILPLDKLGATQGMIVEWKERKDGTTQETRRSTGRNIAQTRPEGTRRKA